MWIGLCRGQSCASALNGRSMASATSSLFTARCYHPAAGEHPLR
jgi:hypothetical protein